MTSASKASSTISRAAAFIGSHSSKSPSSDCLVRFRLCSLAGIRRVSWIFLALCFCVACNESPAHRAYLRGIDDESNQSFETRLSHLSEAVRLEPNNAEFLKARGMLYFDNQKYDLAFADLDRSAKFEDRGRAYRIYLRGLCAGRLGHYEEARRDFERAIALRPLGGQFHGGHALALLALQQPSRALTSIEKAIEIEPRDHRWKYLRGVALACLGRQEESIREFGRVVAYTLAETPKQEETDVFFDGMREFRRVGACTPTDLVSHWHYGGRWLEPSTLEEYRR